MKAIKSYYGLGRRKTAIARVWLKVDKPQLLINAKEKDLILALTPLKAVGLEDKFKIEAKIRGGGLASQISALKLGIARALLQYDSDLRPVLRKGGFLTRDPRAKERKKPGLKRARRAPQWQKR